MLNFFLYTRMPYHIYQRLFWNNCEKGSVIVISYVDTRKFTFHTQSAQALQACDYPIRVEFPKQLMQEWVLQPNFSSHTLFTNDATFTRDYIFRMININVWVTEIHHDVRQHTLKISSLNVRHAYIEYSVCTYIDVCIYIEEEEILVHFFGQLRFPRAHTSTSVCRSMKSTNIGMYPGSNSYHETCTAVNKFIPNYFFNGHYAACSSNQSSPLHYVV